MFAIVQELELMIGEEDMLLSPSLIWVDESSSVVLLWKCRSINNQV